MRSYTLWLLVLFLPFPGFSQDQFTLSGYVKDAASGETLIGANIYIKSDPGKGTSSNTYGFYSLTLEEGSYQIVCSYLGYSDYIFDIDFRENTTLDLKMRAGLDLAEVVVVAEEKDENVTTTEMGKVDLSSETLKRIPSLFGEVDVLKAIQLLPGVLSSGEGSAGFYVRGGGADQNLVLLDEAVVYNTGHLFGFFSVFNADAIKKTTLHKGSIPASYGGRISSVLDIQMKDGNNQNFEMQGGIGTISSRLTLEGPIIKNKASFIISGRRTYLFDIAQPAIKKTDFGGTNYFFYDFNAKVNFQISPKDKLFLSGYFGRDVLDFNLKERGFEFKMPYGNATTTLRWNHIFSDKLFVNTSLIYNDYQFEFSAGQETFTFFLNSGVRDINGKVDFEFYPSPKHVVKWGANYTYHKFTPNVVTGSTGDEEFESTLKPKYAHESAIYVSDDFKVSSKFSLSTGLRLSMFNQVGPYQSSIEDKYYEKGELVKTYASIEPRLSFRLQTGYSQSVKGGVSLATQYAHLVSNSTSTLPTDLWVPSTEKILPQRGIQYSLGYFKNFQNDMFETSVEVYYRDLINQLDYREDYVDNAADVENDFVSGEGNAYGIEFLVRKNSGKLNGWISYTLSKTQRWFDEIENGRVFPTSYDRTNDLAVVLNYTLNEKWNFGVNFVYGTGRPYTAVESLYFIEQTPHATYGPRNSVRLPDYSRLDLAATWIPNPKSGKDFQSSWTFSIYNVYNRKNPFFLTSEFNIDDNTGNTSIKSTQITLFPIIPSITWNFKWKPKK